MSSRRVARESRCSSVMERMARARGAKTSAGVNGGTLVICTTDVDQELLWCGWLGANGQRDRSTSVQALGAVALAPRTLSSLSSALLRGCFFHRLAASHNGLDTRFRVLSDNNS